MRYKLLFILFGLTYGSSCSAPKSDKRPSPANHFKTSQAAVRDSLSGTWILQSINGKALEPSQITRLRPFIDLSFSEQKMTGYTACNQMSAPLSLQKTMLVFGPVKASKTSCPSLSLEKKLLSQLSGQRLFFDLRRSKLILTNEVSRLTFRRPSRY